MSCDSRNKKFKFYSIQGGVSLPAGLDRIAIKKLLRPRRPWAAMIAGRLCSLALVGKLFRRVLPYPVGKTTVHQNSILRDQTLRAFCPWEGTEIKSRTSFPLGGHSIAYEFKTRGVFYFCLFGPPGYQVPILFFPETEHVVTWQKKGEEFRNLEKELNGLVSNMTAFSSLVEQYRKSPLRHTTVEVGLHGNFAHYLMNELAGLEDIESGKLLGAIDRYVVYNQPLGSFAQLMDVPADFCSDARWPYLENRFSAALECSNFLCPLTGKGFSRRFKERLVSKLRCSQEEPFAKRFPAEVGRVVWISVKSGDRTLADQEDFIVSLIKELTVRDRDCGIVLAGVGKPDDWCEEVGGRIFKHQFINDHKQIMDAIQMRVGLERSRVISLNDLPLPVFLSSSQRIHSYFVHWGTVQHLAGWLSDCHGMVHGNSTVVRNVPRLRRFSRWLRDDRYEVVKASSVVDELEEPVFDDRRLRGRVSLRNYKIDKSQIPTIAAFLLR